MKSKIMLLVLFAQLIVCAGCNKTPDPEPAGQEYISVIKLSSEYQDGLILMPQINSVQKLKEECGRSVFQFEYGDSLVFSNIFSDITTNEALCDYDDDAYLKYLSNDLKLPNCPWYIRIDDDYVIPTWKWRENMPLTSHFIVLYDYSDYFDNTHDRLYTIDPRIYWELVNAEYYYLNVRNSDIKNLTQKWAISAAEKIDKPTIRTIHIKELDKYRKQKMRKKEYDFYTSSPYILNDQATWIAYNLSTNTNKEIEAKYIAIRDSMDLIYAETIRQMIINNDFEKCTTKF